MKNMTISQDASLILCCTQALPHRQPNNYFLLFLHFLSAYRLEFLSSEHSAVW